MKSAAYHKTAMRLVDKARQFAFEGESKRADKTYRQAMTFEKKSALAAKKENIGEPSVSILFRSAASIALQVQEWEDAKNLAAEGLTKMTPADIAKELRSILKRVAKRAPVQLTQRKAKVTSLKMSRRQEIQQVRRLAKLFRDQPHRGFSIHELVRISGVPKTVLKSIFQEIYGTSPYMYILRVRLEDRKTHV